MMKNISILILVKMQQQLLIVLLDSVIIIDIIKALIHKDIFCTILQELNLFFYRQLYVDTPKASHNRSRDSFF